MVMCVRIYNRDTHEEADSPAELREMFGRFLPANKHYKEIKDDSCLCQVDVKAAASLYGFEYEEQDGDPMDVHVWKAQAHNDPAHPTAAERGVDNRKENQDGK